MKKEISTDLIINPDTPLYTISTAAKMLGISVHTVRMYERAGLILPFQKESSHRLYSQSDIERLKCLRKGINEDKISIAGIQRIHALIPCWEIIQCSQIDRANCEAYIGHSKGCWSFKHTKNICATQDCRSCVVYKESVDCNKIKNKIKSLSAIGASN